jgi:hypothetical protein
MQHFSNADAHEERLKLIIEDLVIDRRSAGDALTWRVLNEIEAAALTELRKQRDLDPGIVEAIIEGCKRVRYPKTDELVDFGRSNVNSVSAELIGELYSGMHS